MAFEDTEDATVRYASLTSARFDRSKTALPLPLTDDPKSLDQYRGCGSPDGYHFGARHEYSSLLTTLATKIPSWAEQVASGAAARVDLNWHRNCQTNSY